ncbi:uncharacterized [Tachysurus ichikawai]
MEKVLSTAESVTKAEETSHDQREGLGAFDGYLKRSHYGYALLHDRRLHTSIALAHHESVLIGQLRHAFKTTSAAEDWFTAS